MEGEGESMETRAATSQIHSQSPPIGRLRILWSSILGALNKWIWN